MSLLRHQGLVIQMVHTLLWEGLQEKSALEEEKADMDTASRLAFSGT